MVAERLRGLVFEKENVVGFHAGHFIQTDGIHFFAIRSSVGDPDFVVHDDGSGPCAAGDGGFPDDIFVLAPLGGESMDFAVPSRWVVAVVGGATESRPLSLAGGN